MYLTLTRTKTTSPTHTHTVRKCITAAVIDSPKGLWANWANWLSVSEHIANVSGECNELTNIN